MIRVIDPKLIERVLNISKDFPTALRKDLADDGFEIIEPDGKVYRAFSQRQWHWDSFLARRGGSVYVALVTARHAYRGYFRKLVEEIERGGMPVAVIAPLGEMVGILERWGFKPAREFITGETVDVWRKPPKS